MLPINIYMMFKTNRKLYYLTFVLNYVCLLSTYTRSAWIAFAVQLIILLVYFFKHNKNELSKFYKLIVILLVCTISFDLVTDYSVSQRILSIFIDIEKIATNTDILTVGSSRFDIWAMTPELFKNHPFFGYGLENLTGLTDSGIIFDRMHNEILDVLISSGIFALIFYLLFLFKQYKEMFCNFFKTHNKLQLLVVICCVGYFTQSLLNISMPGIASIYWVLLGLTNIDYES